MRKSEKKAKKTLTAPFFLLTFGDLMTLLLTFFVLLFSVSTLEVVKFQAQIGAIQGALGISKFYSHAPMQKELPSPSVKVNPKKIMQSQVRPSTLDPLAEFKRIDLTAPVQHQENEEIKKIQTLGANEEFEVNVYQDEVVLVLPSFGIFKKNSYKVDKNSPDVQRLIPLYNALGKQIAALTDYEIQFVGHTDAIPLQTVEEFPRNNMELGFLRAVNMYKFFFEKNLPDKTRITFSSQGDNVPIIPDEKYDSARKKNRRVEILLKKVIPNE